MRVLIAEDEILIADDLQRRLQRLQPDMDIVGVVHDGLAAQQALQALAPDVAFLDIRMPGLSGMDAARSAPDSCRVVFVTAYDEYAVAAFEQAAADYLLKPISDERLAKCLSRLRTSAEVDTGKLLAQLQTLMQRTAPQPLRLLRAQVGQQVKLVAVDDVCYFQSADKYTAVFTRDAELLLRTPLKELMTQLDAHMFWQVHRGTVVNVRQVVAAHHDELGKVALTLRDRPEKLAVSRSYAHLFRQM
jgi:DNA-binding LytR/AlgR family response regulator